MQCQKKKRDGTQCRARARSGQEHSALHSEPGKAAELGSWGGRGVPFTVPMACRNSLRQKVLLICGTCWRRRYSKSVPVN
jgi:hypothetical protein